MVLFHEAYEQKRFDSRLVEKHVSRGVVTRGEVNEYLKNLPDDSDNAEWSSLDQIEKSDGDQ